MLGTSTLSRYSASSERFGLNTRRFSPVSFAPSTHHAPLPHATATGELDDAYSARSDSSTRSVSANRISPSVRYTAEEASSTHAASTKRSPSSACHNHASPPSNGSKPRPEGVTCHQTSLPKRSALTSLSASVNNASPSCWTSMRGTCRTSSNAASG